jgi:hypothetical protein
MKKRYMLYIDLKQAFDCVDYPILIDKLQKKGVNTATLNTIFKLYNSSLVSVNMRDIYPVNKGVGQGKLCSPLEFDIYIDYLFEEIRSYCSLAFDDDTLFICEERDEFN